MFLPTLLMVIMQSILFDLETQKKHTSIILSFFIADTRRSILTMSKVLCSPSAYIVLAVVLCMVGCKDPNNQLSTTSSAGTFALLDSEITGVHFSNDLQENLETGQNVLDFDYFYNGAGVALEDFDNDGLIDIAFSGNQVDNRIYKNLGQMKFEDMTASSGINNAKHWSTGITTVDINQDGLMDIYICQGGPNPQEKRANLLFLNKGNFKFEEVSESFGLDDSAISTQSVFFDIENDGDLDCLVLNETPLFGFPPQDFYRFLDQQKNLLLLPSSCHLYRNDSQKFTDITVSSGILNPAFGLGVSIADINQDGLQDIYIANDYFVPDVLYINQGNGTFADETKKRLNQLSFYGMGMDIEDINRDSYADILVLDMASADHIRSKTLMASMDIRSFNLLTQAFDFPYQYMFNSLQLNDGSGHYKNISHHAGLSKTDWSWAALISDYDLDGYNEIYVTNGYRKYSKDNDFQRKVSDLKSKYKDEIPMQEKADLYAKMPSEKLSNLYYKNNANLSYEERGKSTGLDFPSFSNGAAYGDLDNDGDLDLVVNNIDEHAFLFKNVTKEETQNNHLGLTLPQELLHSQINIHSSDSHVQSTQFRKVKGYLSALSSKMIFGLGTTSIDSITISHHSGNYKLTAPSANSSYNISDFVKTGSTPTQSTTKTKRFERQDWALAPHIENVYNDFQNEILLPYKQSTLGPKLVLNSKKGTLENTFFISGAYSEYSKVYTMNKQGSLSSVNLPGKLTEDISCIFFDMDNDGDDDIYVITGGNSQLPDSDSYKDKLYINEGNRYRLRTDLIEDNKLYSGGCGIKVDINNDGIHELLVANRISPQRYPKHAPAQLFQISNGKLIDIIDEVAPQLKDFGIINDLCLVDTNGDGIDELVVVGEWTGIGVFNIAQGQISLSTKYNNLLSTKGWWYSITKTDVDNDQKPELIIGNLGLNSKYKASAEKPFKVFAEDFDRNGSHDIVLSNKYKDEYVPLRGLECSSEQMPFIKDKFESYASFANANISDILGTDLARAYSKEANELASILVRFDSGRAITSKLPAEAQLRPILDGVSIDLDHNGFLDAILIGNIYETEVETPRLDYNTATVLLSDGKQLIYSPEYSNELLVKNSKSIEKLESNDDKHIVIGNNNDSFSIYKIKE